MGRIGNAGPSGKGHARSFHCKSASSSDFEDRYISRIGSSDFDPGKEADLGGPKSPLPNSAKIGQDSPKHVHCASRTSGDDTTAGATETAVASPWRLRSPLLRRRPQGAYMATAKPLLRARRRARAGVLRQACRVA